MTDKSYLLPEWEKTRSILMAWPYPGSDWQANLVAAQRCYIDMLHAFSQVVDVWLLLHPSIDLATFRQRLEDTGLNLARIHIENSVMYNDTWTRDYGPLSCNSGYIQFQFNGWGGKYSAADDNRVPSNIRNWLGASPIDAGFVCEGGGLETNGSVLLVNKDCIVDPLRNPTMTEDEVSRQLQRWLGVEAIEWLSNIHLTGDDTDGHIDTIARFVAVDVVVYAGRNAAHVDASSLLALHQQLEAIAAKRGWSLFELPSPQICSAIDGRVLPATYANFLLCNQHVFLPVYGVAEDALAIAVIERACPSYKVVPVRCQALLEQHGSLHCATMQVMDITP